jgi:glycolate oxidase iron-sulfur subunit
MPASDLANLLEEVSRCSNCGLCQAACPIFRVTGKELAVARGRNQVLKGLAQGNLEWSQDLYPILFQCLLCRACMPQCFPAIPTHQIMARARALYLERFGESDILRILFSDILPYPSRMNALVRAAALGQRSGLARLVPALKIFAWFSKSLKTLAQSQELVPPLPERPLRTELAERAHSDPSGSDRVAYFIGCGINYMLPKVGKATIKVLDHIGERGEKYRGGARPLILENFCCGLPAYSYGYIDAARLLARKNIDLILESGADTVISECASCSSFLKDYPGLFEDDPDYKARAREVSSRIRDLSEWVAQENWPESKAARIVTFHEPCHLGRYQDLAEKPRNILAGIPNIEYREMKEADWCCGGAGTYNVSQYELSMKVLDRKMNNIRETGADLLVTECPACMVQLAYGLKRHKLDQPILMSLSELLSSLI